MNCNCPVGMRYHAVNCPDKPGQPQNLPAWMRPKDEGIAAALDVVAKARLEKEWDFHAEERRIGEATHGP